MASYRICTLFSGSKGNCTYIETSEAKILIDMGKNCKAVCRVPVGKGKVIITCPRCGGKIEGKT